MLCTASSENIFQKAVFLYLRSRFQFCAIRKYFLSVNAILPIHISEVSQNLCVFFLDLARQWHPLINGQMTALKNIGECLQSGRIIH